MEPRRRARQPSRTALPPRKPDAKKAKEAYKKGLEAERDKNWQVAYEAYGEAVESAPNDHEYLLRREVVKGRLIQAKVELAEKDAVSGRLGDARKELLEASYLDPSDRSITERLAQLTSLEPARGDEVREQPQLMGPIHLDYRRETQNINYRGDVRGAYEQVAQQFGLQVAFDVELTSRPVHLFFSHLTYQKCFQFESFQIVFLGSVLDTKKPVFFFTISILNSRTIFSMKLTITIPILSSISILNSRTIFSMKLIITIPILSSISTLNSRTIFSMKLIEIVVITDGAVGIGFFSHLNTILINKNR